MFEFVSTNAAGGRFAVMAALMSGAVGLASSASAVTVGPDTFNNSSDFTDHYTVIAQDGAKHIQVSNDYLRLPDSGENGPDGALAVRNNPEGGQTFNATQISTRADTVWSGTNRNRRYGVSILGGNGASYVALGNASGNQFSLNLVTNERADGQAGTSNTQLDSDDSVSYNPTNDNALDRIVLSADVNQTTGTADLTAELFTEGNFDSPAATLTADNRILATDGTTADGEAGMFRPAFSPRNGRAEFTNFAIDYTPVPEPASLALLGLGGLTLFGRRRRA